MIENSEVQNKDLCSDPYEYGNDIASTNSENLFEKLQNGYQQL